MLSRGFNTTNCDHEFVVEIFGHKYSVILWWGQLIYILRSWLKQLVCGNFVIYFIRIHIPFDTIRCYKSWRYEFFCRHIAA